MKSYVVILLSFFPMIFILSCSKNDATYPNVGILYNSKNSGAEISQEENPRGGTPAEMKVNIQKPLLHIIRY